MTPSDKEPGDQDSRLFFLENGAAIPAVAGAYVLLIVLDRALEVTLVGRRPAILVAGRYLYCGSAWGLGGLAARIGRHQRRGKSVHWHVDRLTEIGRVAGAWVAPGGRECQLAAALTGLPVPLPGFGSRDCRVCASHLFAWPDDAPRPEILSDRGPDGVGDGRSEALCCLASQFTGNGAEDSR